MTTHIVAKSSPRVTSFGAAVTKGKIGSDSVGSEEVISGIIGSWKHLVHADLQAALQDFAIATRASAHMVVNWANRGHTIVNDLLLDLMDYIERERKRDRWWGRERKKLGLTKA